MNGRLKIDYFQENNALFLAKDLLGKTLVRKFDSGAVIRSKITETEAYLGSEDLANHASKGRTQRTELMFGEGGYVYVYLIYGRYWLLNIVTGGAENPEAVLIRGIERINGPGRIGNLLKLDKSFYGESLADSNRIWLEDSFLEGEIVSSPRIGVDYAGSEWRAKPWRFVLEPK